MIAQIPKPRFVFGAIAFALAMLNVLWLPLGILEIVPFAFTLPGQTGLRTHAGVAVGLLLVAAWGFWER